MRSINDPLHPRKIANEKARARRAERQALGLNVKRKYSGQSTAGCIWQYCIWSRYIGKDLEVDSGCELMLTAMVKEYARTGVNRFTKAECERLAGGYGKKWARNRFKKLLVMGYLLSGPEGVMINFDKVIVEE